ncbi:LLM class flavin-dependent oxidoreductase [Rhodococcus oxybenzonivorans]|nr:LLM class flavin-dependent oxidoreductase [Rhodococcus oxybenzonivorans]MDV7353693.1 LLM class flavin-dependent oxidoreductase [Rhodococcus oxybenzonivorans]
MTDYGHDLTFGSFITPANNAPEQVVELALTSERAGLDLATFQDHPYQPGFLDTWTLLSYIAARTERIHLAPNVLNLPLRPPAVVARSAASLDLLSGGRLELGLGAGAFWDAIEGMGGRRLTPGQGVDALSEAIDIIRGIWDTDSRDLFRVDGTFYQVNGVKRGPTPAHDIGIWLGAYKPRMLRLTGRKADGWMPSMSYMGSLADLNEGNSIIDDAAAGAGRDPRDVRRLLNINGRFGRPNNQLLAGTPEQWAEQLATLTLQYGISSYILGSDDATTIERFGQEVAPAVRELVAKERTPGAPHHETAVRLTAPGRGGAGRTPSAADPGAELSSTIDYAALPNSLADKAITPRDAGYYDLRSSYMAAGRPGLVIMAKDATDVEAAVTFAATQDAELSVRSGGHGISGSSTNVGGIIIDVSQLDTIEILDTATRRFRVGPGATWGHVAQALAVRGWAMTSGNYGDVGVGGLATAGGLGWLVRKYGMTVDHIKAAEIVLADGSRVRADEHTNADLFWAVRGAGASVGIVTALEFDAIELSNVVFANFTFDATDTAGFLERWARYLADAPRELTSFLNVYPAQAGHGPVAQALSVWAGQNAEPAVAALEPMLSLAPVIDQQAQLVPYSVLVAPTDNRHIGQQKIKIRNGYLPQVTTADAAALAKLLDQHSVMQLELRSVGGAVSDIDSDAMAFAHRTPQVLAAVWALPDMDDDLDRAWNTITPHLDGMYVSYTSDTRPERIHDAYPASTYRRLTGIKRRYDPNNLFRRGLTIPTSNDADVADALR